MRPEALIRSERADLACPALDEPAHRAVLATNDAVDFRSAIPLVLTALSRRRHYRRRVRLIAVVADLLSITLAFAIGAVILYSSPFDVQARSMLAAVLPVFLVLAVSRHAYSMGVVSRAWVGAARAIGAFVVTLGIIGLVSFFLHTVGGTSRGVLGVGALLSVALIAGCRYAIALHAHALLGETTINEVVIRDGTDIQVSPGVILLDAQRDGIALQLDNPAMLDRLGRCLREADRVVVSCPHERRTTWVSALKSCNVNAEIIARDLDELGAFGLGRYEGDATLKVASAPLSLVDQIFKRALDLGLMLVVLPFVAPLMAVVALMIKIDSPGPVFFMQPRVGLGNRVFRVFKFRSMHVAGGDSTGGRSTSRGDPRVTRVGRIIRATSVDELPQLLNVLRGDMSIVGPRPHPLESKAENRLFWDIDGRYWHRHAVKPGMTGLAQVRGFRGTTEKESDLVNRLQADLEYAAGWSIWRDMGIIMSTFRVLVHRNAF